MNKFKFFLVAIAATAMMFSSCKKDDEDENKNNSNENPTTEETIKNTETIVVTAPEVVYPKQYQYVGVVDKIDFKWEKPTVKKVSHVYDETTKSYNDTETELTDCSFKYELCYSTDGTTWETSDKVSELELSKNVTLEEEKTYYYKINTYLSYGNTKDSLIQKYEYEFDDDVTIPFYSTYEQKHHFGIEKILLWKPNPEIGVALLSWAKGCDCKITWLEVLVDDNGKYTYNPFDSKTFNDGSNYTAQHIVCEKMAFEYVLTGKYNETGIVHLMPIDGSKYVYDRDFNVYEKKSFITEKKCAVLPKDAKNLYGEALFEYAPSGRIKRYNTCSYTGEIVTYDDWKEFSKGTSDMQFMINYQRLLGATEENATYPFLKNGEFVCYDKDYSGVDYESKNFNNSCNLIEVTEDYSNDNYEDWFDNK